MTQSSRSRTKIERNKHGHFEEQLRMSQSELVGLWVTHMDFLVVLFVAFMSATSAFVIVANIKGKDLSSPACRLVRWLYVVASVFFLVFMGKVAESILNLRGQMFAANMEWYNAVYEPQFILPLILVIGFVVAVSLVVGSLWYLRSVRKESDS
jgi:hypothetical protein